MRTGIMNLGTYWSNFIIIEHGDYYLLAQGTQEIFHYRYSDLGIKY